MYALEKEESQQVAPDCLDLATLQDAKLWQSRANHGLPHGLPDSHHFVVFGGPRAHVLVAGVLNVATGVSHLEQILATSNRI